MNSKQFSEEDLVKLFKIKKQTNLVVILIWVNRIFVLFFIFAVTFFIINFNALFGNIKFWFKTEVNTEPITDTATEGPVISVPDPNESLKGINSYNLKAISNNSLSIQSTDIGAPVWWNTPNNFDLIIENLKNGVVHLEGTALPGEIGNVFIAGHSSNYIWSKGSYNGIFSLNNKLVIGDLIQIRYLDNDYIYLVSEKKVVKPTDISVIRSDERSTLTLSTCWPLGTSLQRYIVIAEQVYPDPKENKERATEIITDLKEIPNSR